MYFDPRGASLAKRSIMAPPACSSLHDDSGGILVVRRHELRVKPRKFVAEPLTGNDPTMQFVTFALDEPQVAIFFDKKPTITRRHRRHRSSRVLLALELTAPLCPLSTPTH